MKCKQNICEINETFIIESVSSGETPTLTACEGVFTNMVESCVSDTSIELIEDEIIINKVINPSVDSSIDLGSINKRFRAINTISGSSTTWSVNSLNVVDINLGLDSENNSRVITANNSIIDNDTLNGGIY